MQGPGDVVGRCCLWIRRRWDAACEEARLEAYYWFMKTFKALLILLALSLPSFADVIVWSGGGTLQVADAAGSVTKPRTFILVSQHQSANLASSLIIVTPTLRTVKVIGAFNVGYAEVGIPRARTIVLSSGAGGYTNVNNYQNVFLRFKGPKSNIFLRAGNQNPVAMPKTLSSIYNDTSGTPQVVIGTFTMRFDTRRTQDNNAANRDLATTVNDIVGKFVALGYTVVP